MNESVVNPALLGDDYGALDTSDELGSLSNLTCEECCSHA
jgi:hypothetical protein